MEVWEKTEKAKRAGCCGSFVLVMAEAVGSSVTTQKQPCCESYRSTRYHQAAVPKWG